MTIEYKLLGADESDLLSTGIQQVYGDSYPIPEFYDPTYIRTGIVSGKLHCVVAMNRAKEVIGCMSTVLERAGDFTADGSALMIAPEYRGQGIVAGLGSKMVETYRSLGLGGLHLYALALHDLVQNQSQNAGATVTGILPAWFSKRARVAGYDYPEDARIGAVCLYMPLAALPARSCYLPTHYREVLSGIYADLELPRDLRPVSRSLSLPDTSILDIEDKPTNQHRRLIIERTGADFSRALDSLATPLGAEDVEVMYIDIPLCDPAVDHAVERSQEQGFFFGALMVDRLGCDRLRLQRYNRGLAVPDAMVIASSRASALLDYVLSDSESV